MMSIIIKYVKNNDDNPSRIDINNDNNNSRNTYQIYFHYYYYYYYHQYIYN